MRVGFTILVKRFPVLVGLFARRSPRQSRQSKKTHRAEFSGRAGVLALSREMQTVGAIGNPRGIYRRLRRSARRGRFGTWLAF